MKIMTCKICGNTKNNTPYTVREMAFGTREKFNYFQCANCGCLQITELPSNIEQHYPNNYYSFSSITDQLTATFTQRIKHKLIEYRDMYAITGKGFFGRILNTIKPSIELQTLRPYHITQDTSFLDIGCGNGALLRKLQAYGFYKLLGVDPYIEKTIHYRSSLDILKDTADHAQGKWDVVMLHHALEHMPDQVAALRTVAEKLSPNGLSLIRIPTVSSYAWEHYRENWVHLDAPRHFFLHSHKSLTLATKQAGLVIKSITSDTSEFSFYGSESYTRDIPSFEFGTAGFSKADLRAFRKKANKLNKEGRGDTIAVILKRATS